METNGKSCNICHRMNSVELASLRCIDCCDDLCEKCAETHHASRLSMDHRVLSLDDAEAVDKSGDVVGFCEKHENRKLEVYCFDDEMACCLMCATIDHRKCKMVESLEDCAKQTGESEVDKLRETLKEFNQECADDIASISKNEASFGAQVDDVRARIQTMKESVLKFLNDKETEFLEHLQSVQSEKNASFAAKVKMLTGFQEKAGIDIKKIEDSNTCTNKVALFLEMKETEKNHRELKRELQALQRDYRQTDLKLEDESYLAPILLEDHPFGKVVVEETTTKSKPDFLISDLVLGNILAKSGCRMTDAETIGDEEHVISVCDNHNQVYLFGITNGFITSAKLSGRPWSMTKIDQTSVAITIRAPQASIELVDIRVEKVCTLSSVDIIKLSFKPNGIAYDNGSGTFIVSSTDGLLRHVDKTGSSLHTVSVTKGYVYGLCFHSRRIIYSHHVDKGKVYALYDDKLGTQEFAFEHEDLSFPLGVTCDSCGNIYVVGCSTNNVLQLKPDGEFVRQILCKEKDEAVVNPMGIRVSLMASIPTLLLTCRNEVRIYRFQTP